MWCYWHNRKLCSPHTRTHARTHACTQEILRNKLEAILNTNCTYFYESSRVSPVSRRIKVAITAVPHAIPLLLLYLNFSAVEITFALIFRVTFRRELIARWNEIPYYHLNPNQGVSTNGFLGIICKTSKIWSLRL